MLVTSPRHRSRGSRHLLVSLVLVALVATFVTLSAGPAAADHVCTEEVITQPNGKVKIIRVCEPHDGDDGGGGGGGDEPNVTCRQTYWPIGTEPVERPVGPGPLIWWRDIQVREDGSFWGEGYFRCTNHDTGEKYDTSWWVCYAVCDGRDSPVPEDVLDGLLQKAVARVNPPLSGIRHTFDQPADDGTIRAIVNAETWWWADSDHTPIVEVGSEGPLWVRVTASPAQLTVDPGDGSEALMCAGLGVPYNREQSYWDQVPGEPRGACVHVYQRIAESVTATMSVTWTLTYEGFAPGLGNVSGTLEPQTREQTATFAVKEIQSVIVR